MRNQCHEKVHPCRWQTLAPAYFQAYPRTPEFVWYLVTKLCRNIVFSQLRCDVLALGLAEVLGAGKSTCWRSPRFER